MKYWDVSWNPVTGCSPCSPGCVHCWAKRMAYRLKGRCGYPKDDPFKVTFHPERLNDPLKWKKPKRIFVCDMGDFFIAPLSFQAPILNTIHKANWHKYFFLTKRIKQMDNFQYCCGGLDVPYLWLGVTICNQQEADEKIPILLQIPAAHRWVSIEPCLSSINIMPYLLPKLKFNPERVKSRKLGWVVLGGETGPKGRPCQEGWVISVKNQCVNAGIPFFFKQWGSWNLSHNQNRLVDGREWNEIPKFKESETS